MGAKNCPVCLASGVLLACLLAACWLFCCTSLDSYRSGPPLGRREYQHRPQRCLVGLSLRMPDRTAAPRQNMAPLAYPQAYDDDFDEVDASGGHYSSDESLSVGPEPPPPVSSHNLDAAAAPTAAARDVAPESDTSLSDSDGRPPGQDGSAIMSARAYQLEMLHESLRRNIIVAVCSPPSVCDLP